MIVFLCSEQASYVTGSAWSADGGTVPIIVEPAGRGSKDCTCSDRAAVRRFPLCNRLLLARAPDRRAARGTRVDSDAGTRRTGRGRLRGARPRARGAVAVAARRALVRARRAPSAEEECSVRTPFQRDRDRILHSKPFRRLKGKTQVFIDPAGDHYRTRMTHTLETTAIARGVARALRLTRTWSRRSASGTTRAIRRSVTPARRRSTKRCASVRRRVQAQRAVAPDRASAQPDSRSSRRDPHAHGRARAGHARGQDRPARGPGRLHQPRHRRRDPLRHPRCRRICRGTRSSSSARAAPRGSTRSSTTWSSTPSGPATSSRARTSARRCSSLRTFMFERVYLGPNTRAQHEQARATVHRDLRAARGARGGRADEIVRLPRPG